MIPGIKFANYNDLESVKQLVNDKTCAIIFETVQGLSLIHIYSGAYTEVKENVDTYRSNSDIMKKYLEYLDNISEGKRQAVEPGCL